MACVDKFYLEIFKDCDELEADLDIIIPHAIIRLLSKTDFSKETDVFIHKLKNLNKIFRKIPEILILKEMIWTIIKLEFFIIRKNILQIKWIIYVKNSMRKENEKKIDLPQEDKKIDFWNVVIL